MVNGLKTDMEHKNTNDKNEYHFQLPEVVVKGKMPGWMRRQLGIALHRNPALFRKCMKNATSVEEEQFYFNLAFNAAKEEAGQQFVQASLTVAGIISAISTAGASLSFASWGKIGGRLWGSSVSHNTALTSRLATAMRSIGTKGVHIVSNAIMRNAPKQHTLSNITAKMLYPKHTTLKMMLRTGVGNASWQYGTNVIYNAYFKDMSFKEAGKKAVREINFVEVGANALGLPLGFSSAVSAAFDYSIEKQESVFDSISAEKFLINWGLGYAFGKVESKIPFEIQNKREIILSVGLNTATQIPHLTETVMQAVYRGLRFGEVGGQKAIKLGTSLTQEYFQSKIDIIFPKTNNKETNGK